MEKKGYDRKVSHATIELAQELQQKRLQGASWPTLETEYDLSRKTITKILRKYGLEDIGTDTPMWDRPCLRCRKNIIRPQGQWLCSACKAKVIDIATGMPSAYEGVV